VSIGKEEGEDGADEVLVVVLVIGDVEAVGYISVI
jgi:hypothetical protein